MDIQDYISSGIIESFVLGLASTEEVEKVVQLRKEYPEVNEAILAFENELETQGQITAIAPPAGVKKALFEKLDLDFADTNINEVSVSAENVLSEAPAPVISISAKGGWRKYLTAAAVVLFMLNAALTIMLYNKYRTLNDEYASLKNEKEAANLRINTLYTSINRMQDPGMLEVKMAGVPGKESSLATVYWDKETKEVFLFKNNLPQAAAGKQYQLWAIVDGKPVDAGVIEENCEGLCKLKNIPNAQAFAITLEKTGGSAVPTLEEMYVVGNT